MSYQPPAGPADPASPDPSLASGARTAPDQQPQPFGSTTPDQQGQPFGSVVPDQQPQPFGPEQMPGQLPSRKSDKRGLKLAVFIGAITLCALFGLGVLVFVGLRIGPLALGVGIVAAILPVPLLVFCFMWLDRYEPEPVKYLVFCFAWGAGAATALSLTVNTAFSALFEHQHLSESLTPTIVAPIIEETTKAAGPLLVFLLRRKAFSGVIDGIVYCGLSATGFAMVENILYLGGYGYARGAEHGGPLAGAAAVIGVFFVRIVMTGFAHPLFTSMTGIGLGVSSRARTSRVRWLAPLGGWLVAMLLHSTWNLVSVVGSSTRQGYLLLYWYVAVVMPIFFGMVGFALWLRASQGRLAEQMLPPYVRSGWFSPPEVHSLGTLTRRMAARHWAKRVAGEAGAKAMREYQFEATKLALLRDRMRRGLGVAPEELPETLAEERKLLDSIAAYRRVFTGRDPATPKAKWDGIGYHIVFPDGVTRALRAPEQPVVPVPVTLARPAVAYPYGPPPFPYGQQLPYR